MPALPPSPLAQLGPVGPGSESFEAGWLVDLVGWCVAFLVKQYKTMVLRLLMNNPPIRKGAIYNLNGEGGY